MSFPVRFYSFNKRTNSTKIPGANDTSTNYQCVFKGPESILNPTISLTLPITQAPTWNYCRIDLFGRWYFVNDWRWAENRIWEADLTVDVLGTYRTAIGSKSYYVLRSATEYNPDLIDSFYPTEAAVQKGFSFGQLTDLWDSIHETMTLNSFKLGTYIVGMVSNTSATNPTDHVMLGGVTYYLFEWSGFQQFIRNLIIDWSDLSVAGVTGNIKNMFFDPFQYLYSVVWLPVSMSHIYHSQNTRTVSYGPVEMSSLTAYTLNEYDYVSGISMSWTLPKHPQVSTRGRFLKASPFTKYKLFIPPFGTVVLDPAKLYDTTTLSCSIRIDPVTGTGYLKISNETAMIDYAIAQVGVQIPMSQVSQDVLGSAAGVLTGTASAVASGIAGNYVGMTAGITGAVTSAVNMFVPEASKSGGTGDFTALCFEAPYLYYEFQILADEDLQDNGRPLCENWTPASIPGYMVVENGITEITGTRDEANRIRDLLEGGFYYE